MKPLNPSGATMVRKLLLIILVIAGVAWIRWNFSVPNAASVRQTGVEFAVDLTELPIGATLKGATFGDDDVIRIAAIPSLGTVVLAESRVTYRGLESLSALKRLHTLDLSDTLLTGEAMDAVAQLSRLKNLRLAGCPWLKDEHLASLVALKKLERLELSSPSITPVGLAQLSQLPALQELTVGVCAAIDDEAVEHLASLTQLKQLTLPDTAFTSRGYAELCQQLPSVKMNVPPESLTDLREVAQRGTFGVSSSGIVDGFGQKRNRDDSYGPLLPGDLTVVGRQKGLKFLGLGGGITDEMFLELGPLPQLEWLALGPTRITDEGLQRVAGFPSLKRLVMFQTEITGPGLKNLKHTPNLTYLEIRTRQGDEVLEHLAPLQELDTLGIRAPITDEELNRMPVLAKLTQAYFRDSQVRGPGIAGLSKQPGLISLGVGGGLVDDTAIEHIAKLTSLRWVGLGGTRVTEEGKARLRNLCPKLEVR
ncbi:MAG: hypothetical protein AABP62_09860 [Planctomycetota bacterium]